MNNTKKVIKVGIADMNIVTSPDIIRTSGLGSCVAVVIYDKMRKIAGLAHIMLPDSLLAKNQSGRRNPAKYADTAIQELQSQLLKRGANKFALKAKIAGGAQMFQLTGNSEILRIGARNVEAVKTQLNELNIPLVAEDTGGNRGRTVEFDPKTGILSIKMVNKEVRYI